MKRLALLLLLQLGCGYGEEPAHDIEVTAHVVMIMGVFNADGGWSPCDGGCTP